MVLPLRPRLSGSSVRAAAVHMFGFKRMPKIILEGYIDVPEADLDVVKSELPEHIELTRKEEGCLVFNVEADPKAANRFNVYEEFVSQEAFEAHQERVRESRWGRVTRNTRRSYTTKSV